MSEIKILKRKRSDDGEICYVPVLEDKDFEKIEKADRWVRSNYEPEQKNKKVNLLIVRVFRDKVIKAQKVVKTEVVERGPVEDG